MFVQIHMLQSMPPGNLNRDENGQPKKCIFGGVTRGRISSQCLKRNIRLSTQFKEAFGDALADRTTYLPRMVADELKKDRDKLGVPDKELNALMLAIASKFKKEKRGNDSEDGEDERKEQDTPNSPAAGDVEAGQTGQLVFFQEPFARRIAELVAALRKDRLPAYQYFLTGQIPETQDDKAKFKTRKDELKKRKAELKKAEKAANTEGEKAAVKEKKAALAKDEKSFKEEAENKKDALEAVIGNFIESAATASKSLTVDIGLFGRMTTSDLVVNIEATCQVAHAISTHETVIESDYFTAMDDRKDKYALTQTERAGAAFLGSGETETFFNSAVYYKYLNLDIDAMRKHLPHMASKSGQRRLSEAEMNAPDLDDDGNLDVEHYLVPDGSGIKNDYLRKVWDEAARQLNAGETDDDEDVGGDDSVDEDTGGDAGATEYFREEEHPPDRGKFAIKPGAKEENKEQEPALSVGAAARAAGVLVSAAALANPTGKQNSFAAHGIPELILVELSKAKRPISYANAFLQAVEGRNLMTESATALYGYIDSVAAAFAPANVRRVLMAVGHASSPALKSTHDRVLTLDKLVEWVVAHIVQSEEGGQPHE